MGEFDLRTLFVGCKLNTINFPHLMIYQVFDLQYTNLRYLAFALLQGRFIVTFYIYLSFKISIDMKIFYVLGTLCISFLTYGQSEVEAQNEIKNNNAVAYTLFKRLTRDHENLVCSPYSLRSCFTMVYPGANGTSKAEIESTFKFVPRPEKQLELWKADYNKVKGNATQMYNSVWVSKGAKVRPDYLGLMIKHTGDSIKALSGAQDVNRWVDTKSGGQINKLVEDKDLADVKLLLVNCITFEDKWVTPFPPTNTKQRTFYTETEIIEVPTMKVDIMVNALQNNTVSILQLPYKGNMTMTIMMPARGKSFEVIEQYCVPDFLKMQEEESDSDAENKLRHGRFDLFLPKFKIASTLNLIQPLKEMGIMDSFYDTSADFSLMKAEPAPWFISMVRQAATIEVSEEGTKAGAATALGMSFRSIPDPLHINRPFVYIIHDKYTGNILFMGQVKRP